MRVAAGPATCRRSASSLVMIAFRSTAMRSIGCCPPTARSCRVTVAPRVAARMIACKLRARSRVRRLIRQQNLGAADDDREEIVEGVRHAAGEPARGLERLRVTFAAPRLPPSPVPSHRSRDRARTAALQARHTECCGTTRAAPCRPCARRASHRCRARARECAPDSDRSDVVCRARESRGGCARCRRAVRIRVSSRPRGSPRGPMPSRSCVQISPRLFSTRCR